MSKSPSSKRYAREMDRRDDREILATRRARWDADREGTSYKGLGATGKGERLGIYAWRALNLNLAKPILRSRRTRRIAVDPVVFDSLVADTGANWLEG